MNKRSCAILLIYCFCLVFLGSCTKDLDLPEVRSEQKIALIGEIAAGDSIHIRAGQTSKVKPGTSITYDILNQLTIAVQDGAGTTLLKGKTDSMTSILNTVPYASTKIATAGQQFVFTATHPYLGTATGTITVPKSFVGNVEDTASEDYSGFKAIRFNVKIDDNQGNNFYVIEAVKQRMDVQGYFFFKGQWLNIFEYQPQYDSLRNVGVSLNKKFDTTYFQQFDRQSIYTNDINTENLKTGTSLTANRRILIKDNAFNNTTYTTTVFLNKNINGNRGRILLFIKSVPEEYFNFLKAYEQYDPSGTYNAVALPVKVKGNVENGFGMIGAAYKLQFTYLLDSWDF